MITQKKKKISSRILFVLIRILFVILIRILLFCVKQNSFVTKFEAIKGVFLKLFSYLL